MNPTRTVNAQHPQGFNDWIITLTPGQWHTHPDPKDPIASTNRFIHDVIEDRSILQVWYKDNQAEEVRVLTDWETVESETARFDSDPIPDYSITHRLWSGKILPITPDSPQESIE